MLIDNQMLLSDTKNAKVGSGPALVTGGKNLTLSAKRRSDVRSKSPLDQTDVVELNNANNEPDLSKFTMMN